MRTPVPHSTYIPSEAVIPSEPDLVGLADLAQQIDQEHRACEADYFNALGHALRCGELLSQAKGQVKHGEWLPWLRQHGPIPERAASTYMKLYRELPDRLSVRALPKSAIPADLSLTQAVKLITAPPKPKPERAADGAGAGEDDEQDAPRQSGGARDESTPAPPPDPFQRNSLTSWMPRSAGDLLTLDTLEKGMRGLLTGCYRTVEMPPPAELGARYRMAIESARAADQVRLRTRLRWAAMVLFHVIEELKQETATE